MRAVQEVSILLFGCIKFLLALYVERVQTREERQKRLTPVEPPYRHLCNTETSLLRSVHFERDQSSHKLYFCNVAVTAVPMVTVFTKFDFTDCTTWVVKLEYFTFK